MARKEPFLIIFALDFIAFALALAAEQTRSTAKVLTDAEMNYYYCVYDYDSKIATVFGAIAFTILFIGQASQCFCFRMARSPKGFRSYCTIALSIICWATFLTAEACLIWGSVSNSQQTKYRFIFTSNNVNCHTLRKGVFEAGAGFIMITSLLSSMSHTYRPRAQEEFLGFHGSNGDKGEYSLMLVTSSD